MKETTLTFLLDYLRDDTKWPFLWDGTMGAKYVIGGVYRGLLTIIREKYELLVATPVGFQYHKENGYIFRLPEIDHATTQFADAVSLVISRDRIVRHLIKKVWDRQNKDTFEVGYELDLDGFAQYWEKPYQTVHFERPEDIVVDPFVPQRTYIPSSALAQKVIFLDEMMHVELKDRRVISVPIEWFPKLQNATLEQRNHHEIVGGGLGLFWPELDEDILVASLLAGGISEP
jgi:hypothetical protein